MSILKGVRFCMDKKQKILMVAVHTGFRDEELFIPKEIFEKEGFEVVVASNSPGQAIGKLGGTIPVDLVISHVHPDDYAALVVVGGPGVAVLFNNLDLFGIVRDFSQKRKVTSAICSAPVVFANAGILNSKKATCFSEQRDKLENGGAFYTGHLVERDGDIITGSGPEASKEFAEAVVKAIHWQTGEQDIRADMRNTRKRF